MYRTHKDIQEKKYRKLLIRHQKETNKSLQDKIYKKSGLKRRWDVSKRYRKHYLYQALKEVLPMITDWEYQITSYTNGHINKKTWSEISIGPDLKGIYAKDFRALDLMKQMCFCKIPGIPDEINPLLLTLYEIKAGPIYNEKYFLRDELKELLYLREEINYTRVWNTKPNSEYEKRENYIRKNGIRIKYAKTCGWKKTHSRRDWFISSRKKTDKILVKQYKKDIEEVW